MSVIVVVVIATAVAVTIWRYEAALSRSADAVNAHTDTTVTETLAADFWHEREAIRAYMLVPSAQAFNEVASQKEQFADGSETPGVANTAAEARFLAQSLAGNTRFYAQFRQLRGAAERPRPARPRWPRR